MVSVNSLLNESSSENNGSQSPTGLSGRSTSESSGTFSMSSSKRPRSDSLSPSESESVIAEGKERGRQMRIEPTYAKKPLHHMTITGFNDDDNSSIMSPADSIQDNFDDEVFEDQLPKCRVDPKFIDKELVSIAIRRKAGSKRVKSSPTAMLHPSTFFDSHLKLHIKLLEAGLRVNLTLVSSLAMLYQKLTPNVNVRNIQVFEDSGSLNEIMHEPLTDVENDFSKDISNKSMVTKNVQLIDNNYNMAGFSNKILQSFRQDQGIHGKNYQIFNSLSTAVKSLFGVSNFSLVRVTRSANNDAEGSSLLKLECANPGDLWLIDEEDFIQEMFYSLSKKGDVPNSLFIKKIVARPRYKSGMKIYFIPETTNRTLYVDPRMLEKDLINGVIDPQSQERPIYTAFNYKPILEKVNKLVQLTQKDKAEQAHASINK